MFSTRFWQELIVCSATADEEEMRDKRPGRHLTNTIALDIKNLLSFCLI
jgi:hypothetical protein